MFSGLQYPLVPVDEVLSTQPIRLAGTRYLDDKEFDIFEV